MTTRTRPLTQFHLRAYIAKRWRKFDDDDLDEIGNSARRLAQALREKYHLSPDEADRQVHAFICRAWNEHRQSEWLAG
jgi:hypothetical protein